MSDAFSSTEHSSTLQEMPKKGDTPRFLVTIYVGIGDAVSVGLSAIDQIMRNDPDAYQNIDILCNDVQRELFQYDPRVNKIIHADKSLFPSPEVATWLKGIIMGEKAAQAVHFLRDRHYQAVFPGIFAPAFYYRLHSCVMYPSLFKIVKEMLSLRSHADMPISTIARQMVNKYFGDTLPVPTIDEAIPLYMSSEHVQQAKTVVEHMKAQSSVPQENCKVLLVASDTASIVTRPPTRLLVDGIAGALRGNSNLIVLLLPAYTDKNAAQAISSALSATFAGRIFMLPAEPRASLLETTALIDQADIFVTGDTGVMHLAAASKKIRTENTAGHAPRNTVQILALFGGTNPGFYGYSKRTRIVGKGRKEQAAYRPGIAKESYNPKGRDLFDHISPGQLTEAIMCVIDYGK